MVIEFTIHPDVLASAMKEWAEIDAFLEKRHLPRSALNYTHWAAGDVMSDNRQVMLAPRYGDEPTLTCKGDLLEVRLSSASFPLLQTGFGVNLACFGLWENECRLVLKLSGEPMPTQAETAAYTRELTDREASEQAKPSAEWLAQIAARQEKPRE